MCKRKHELPAREDDQLDRRLAEFFVILDRWDRNTSHEHIHSKEDCFERADGRRQENRGGRPYSSGGDGFGADAVRNAHDSSNESDSENDRR